MKVSQAIFVQRFVTLCTRNIPPMVQHVILKGMWLSALYQHCDHISASALPLAPVPYENFYSNQRLPPPRQAPPINR